MGRGLTPPPYTRPWLYTWARTRPYDVRTGTVNTTAAVAFGFRNFFCNSYRMCRSNKCVHDLCTPAWIVWVLVYAQRTWFLRFLNFINTHPSSYNTFQCVQLPTTSLHHVGRRHWICWAHHVICVTIHLLCR
jgi:hypothetical protein